jgi:hypothetical protein
MSAPVASAASITLPQTVVTPQTGTLVLEALVVVAAHLSHSLPQGIGEVGICGHGDLVAELAGGFCYRWP